jgi:hypothetical protein
LKTSELEIEPPPEPAVIGRKEEEVSPRFKEEAGT